ncbi:MAG: tryptophan 2-C-methyltransferase [Hyphomicrobiaceae bacterium]|nr:tryptophan 2-C-methyltransferase [Hyphomicrobiaceae bacterium]
MSHLVSLVNPNQVQPGITPYALDVLTTHLERAGFTVEVLDLTFPDRSWQAEVEDYFAGRNPILVGVTLRNTDTVVPQEQRTFLEDHRAIIDAIKRSCTSPIVVGGVGYSSMPSAMLRYLQVPFGVAGPGEVTLVELANAIAAGSTPDSVPGLHILDGSTVRKAPTTRASSRTTADAWLALNEGVAYDRRSHQAFRVDNRKYYERGGLGNILTKNGCPLDCVHCSEPFAKGQTLSRRTVKAVVDEMEQLTDQGVLDLHTTDSEFNVGIGHAKQVLKEIIVRRRRDSGCSLNRLKLWTYLQPRPFDEELAVLLREAGCKGASVGSDHTNPEILAGFKLTQAGKPFYGLDDIRETNRLLMENGMLVTQELILGMPGETLETMRQCIDDMLALNSTVLGITFGLKVFPHTPFGRRLARQSDGKPIPGLQSNAAIGPITLLPLEKCRDVEHYERQFMFDENGRIRPIFYFSPDLPEDPENIADPSGRWRRSIEFIWDHIPKAEHYRVSLPTLPGDSKDDNNYADNPFLKCWVSLGYRGAFYSKWRERDQIIQEAIDKGIARMGPDKKLIFEGAPAV